MTVKELIFLLEQEDPDAFVWVEGGDGAGGSNPIVGLVSSQPDWILLGINP